MDMPRDQRADLAVPGVVPRAGMLDGAVAAFGMSAIVTILFNTLLAWVKDAFDPLNNFMVQLTGHHWITHGLADVILFLVVGTGLMLRGYRVSGNTLALGVAAASIVGGGGLLLWFFLF
jgi:hypothetical protein